MVIHELRESTPVHWYRHYFTSKSKGMEISKEMRQEFKEKLEMRMEYAYEFEMESLEDILFDLQDLESRIKCREIEYKGKKYRFYKSPYVSIEVSEEFKGEILDEVIKELLSQILAEEGVAITKVAARLGVSGKSLRKMIERYSLNMGSTPLDFE